MPTVWDRLCVSVYEKKNPPSGRSLTISFDLLDPVDKTFDGGGGVRWGGVHTLDPQYSDLQCEQFGNMLDPGRVLSRPECWYSKQ